MPISESGDGLVFLISQPRSGSTLLQRMLGSHPAVHTTSEPWLMLHPLYALKPNGLAAEYDARVARQALEGFLAESGGGREAYLAGVRRMVGPLYARAAAYAGARLFLDKTPRYYYIIPELRVVFPEARFILLVRNPLAVLASVIDTWVTRNPLELADYRDDLLRAPGLIQAARTQLGDAGVTVRYEDLIRDPDAEVERVCAHLEIDFDPAMIDYGADGPKDWLFGDERTVHTAARPITDSLDKWTRTLDNPQRWRLSHDYLEALGPDLFTAWGYDVDELRATLRKARPGRLARRCTVSLDWLLRASPDQRSRFDHTRARAVHELHKRGASGFAAFLAGAAARRTTRP